MADSKLTIEIKNQTPVELLDLTTSFFSFADEYKEYILNAEEKIAPDETRLYIKEIKTGSIIADLISYAPYALPYIENANIILGFAAYLKTAYDFFLGRNNKKLEKIGRKNLENLCNIIEPVAKDSGSQFNCFPVINGNVELTININNVEANAAQNKIKKALEALRAPVSGTHEKVLMYWYQARNDVNSKYGDKAIIESLCKRPVKVVWADESIKSKMLLDSENPFMFSYIVDVVVETVNEVPNLYKIIRVYDKVEKNFF